MVHNGVIGLETIMRRAVFTVTAIRDHFVDAMLTPRVASSQAPPNCGDALARKHLRAGAAHAWSRASLDKEQQRGRSSSVGYRSVRGHEQLDTTIVISIAAVGATSFAFLTTSRCERRCYFLARSWC